MQQVACLPLYPEALGCSCLSSITALLSSEWNSCEEECTKAAGMPTHALSLPHISDC